MLEIDKAGFNYPIPSARLDYDILAAEIVRALRGALSQREFSKKLKFSFNQVGKWESQATAVRWSDFIFICKQTGIDIEKHLRNSFFWNLEDDFSAPQFLRTLLSFFGTIQRVDDVPVLKKNAANIKKWLRGETEPRFSEVLQFIDQTPLVLSSWLGEFLDLTKIDALKNRRKADHQATELLNLDPTCPLVLAALGTNDYVKSLSHSSKIISQMVGLPLRQIDDAILELLGRRLIRMVNGKYVASGGDLGPLPSQNLKSLTKYLSQRGIDQHGSSVSSCQLHPISEAAAKKISDLTVRFHYQISEILKTDQQPKTKVRCTLVQSFDLDQDSAEK